MRVGGGGGGGVGGGQLYIYGILRARAVQGVPYFWRAIRTAAAAPHVRRGGCGGGGGEP